MKTLKPLLAENCTIPAALPFPVFASPKFDGIRCLITSDANGIQAVSRKLKPIPNAHIRATLTKYPELMGMDGELVTYTDGKMDEFNVVSSKVMSKDGTPDFKFHVFDLWTDADQPFNMRDTAIYETIHEELPASAPVVHVRQEMIYDVAALDAYEAWQLALGFEGVMVRKTTGIYKFGRSTEKETILLKVKRFTDAEAYVIGVDELMTNNNEAKKNALGQTERSSHKAGLVGRGMLGALRVRMGEVSFSIGTGFSEAQRKQLWQERASLLGKLAKFKSQKAGEKDAPRFPVFLGFRHQDDL